MNLKRALLPALAGLAFPALLLLVWALGSGSGWISPQTLPHPDEASAALADMAASGALWSALAISLWRVAVGFTLGAAGGLVLGSAMGLSRRTEDYLFPAFKALTYVPLLGWVPLAMLVVGIGEWLKFLLIAKAALVPMTLNTLRGFKATPETYRELAAVYGLGELQYLRHVLLPHAVPALWTGLRYALSYSWLVLVVVELIGSTEGLGYLMINAQQLYQLDVVVAVVVVIGVVGFAIDRGLADIETRLLRWRPQAFA